MIARIYSPAKTAMQSGKGNTGFWILQYEPIKPKMLEPLMGYTATSDMNSQVRIRFNRKEEAIAFARKNAIPYRVEKHIYRFGVLFLILIIFAVIVSNLGHIKLKMLF